ncbi:NAD-dependent epimerase/dehydratase family protein [Pseudomonadota bacterium]
MSMALITGSAGLIGSASVKFSASQGMEVIGIDNDMRARFFGKEASTAGTARYLEKEVKNYNHCAIDIRDQSQLESVFKKHGSSISLIIHAAAQPSHDWAAREPFTDFSINANGTLNLLEYTRQYCPDAVFVFTSTNKVYGDTPNSLPLVKLPLRWEIDNGHPYFRHGIDESMSIDASKHSLFGASKVAADILVQEYGRYFGIRTVCFRGGCLTGPAHAGTEMHGFLAYLVKCAVNGRPYTVFGYEGKQVRDNIHSDDLVSAFWEFYKSPQPGGAVYNIGGSRFSHCSVMEAIGLTNELYGRELNYSISQHNRDGDHVWWVSDIRKFQNDYPDWQLKYDVTAIISELIEALDGCSS